MAWAAWDEVYEADGSGGLGHEDVTCLGEGGSVMVRALALDPARF